MAEHSLQVTDEEYQVIAEAARKRGQTPDDLLRAWVASLRLTHDDLIRALVASVRQGAKGEEIDPDQAWFWTPEWQAKEREADADLAAGRGTYFDSDEEFLRALDERAKHADA